MKRMREPWDRTHWRDASNERGRVQSSARGSIEAAEVHIDNEMRGLRERNTPALKVFAYCTTSNTVKAIDIEGSASLFVSVKMSSFLASCQEIETHNLVLARSKDLPSTHEHGPLTVCSAWIWIPLQSLTQPDTVELPMMVRQSTPPPFSSELPTLASGSSYACLSTHLSYQLWHSVKKSPTSRGGGDGVEIPRSRLNDEWRMQSISGLPNRNQHNLALTLTYSDFGGWLSWALLAGEAAL